MRTALLSWSTSRTLPRNVYYGDGSPIEDEALATRSARCWMANEIAFPWQAGDVLMLDNMLAAHGRHPFEGPRKVIVAMAEPISAVRGQAAVATRAVHA